MDLFVRRFGFRFEDMCTVDGRRYNCKYRYRTYFGGILYIGFIERKKKWSLKYQ